jgi:L-alanine-DL-glutamate epimerase-like enolase superfamily enzyme
LTKDSVTAGHEQSIGEFKMRRRDILKGMPVIAAAAALPAQGQVSKPTGLRMKITDIKILRLRVIKDLGTFAGFMGPSDTNRPRIGGGSVVEVHTDQGLVGLGPAMDPVHLPALKGQLIGEDPFNIQLIVANMREVTGMGSARRIAASKPPVPPDGNQLPLTEAAGRGGDTSADRAYSAIEIALWDIIGKACNQPLYRLWGPVSDRITPYASQSRLGTPQTRAEFAARIKADGWKAIKYRAHFETKKDDIALVEQTRKLVGDDFDIMCDANQATNGFLTPSVRWSFQRAVETARAYQELDVYWLEEPLPRFDFDHQAELNRLVELPIAGGEGNRGLHEFRLLLERGCFDIVQPEVLLEGPMEIRKIATLAESMNKLMCPHLAEGCVGTICNMHLIASLPNAPYLEITHDLPLADYSNGFAVFEEPPVFNKGGYFDMPQKPGLGMTIKRDLIQSTI